MVDSFLPTDGTRATSTPDVVIRADPMGTSVVDAAMARQMMAREYAAESVFSIPRALPPASLAPGGMKVVHEINGDRVRLLHLEDPGVATVVIRAYETSTTVVIAGRDSPIVTELWDRVRLLAVGHLRGSAVVPCTMWSSGAVRSSSRQQETPSVLWGVARRNYPGRTATALDRLMAMAPPEPGSGRLVLWHGPPGTGKTTAAIALMTAWLPWADAHIRHRSRASLHGPAIPSRGLPANGELQSGGTVAAHEPTVAAAVEADPLRGCRRVHAEGRTT